MEPRPVSDEHLTRLENELVDAGITCKRIDVPPDHGLRIECDSTPLVLIIGYTLGNPLLFYFFMDTDPGVVSEQLPFNGLNEAMSLFERINCYYKNLESYLGDEIYPDVKWHTLDGF
jgi:hypothetical protein